MGGSDHPSKPQSLCDNQEKDYRMIEIYVPELDIHNCLHFSLDQLIWNVKQKCVASLPKELTDSFNYGLFRPPDNGKAAKFLDEHLKLSDYTIDTIGYLELKYKRRIYKTILLDEKLLKSIHTRVNFRRLMKYVVSGKVEKITKMCSKGLDPNFHCPDSGETPLSVATANKMPDKTLAALVKGGAFLDYRALDGSTALHRAVENKSLDAVKALLKLGASPNCKDAKELTPLHVSMTCVVDAVPTRNEPRELTTIDTKNSLLYELRKACKIRLSQLVDDLISNGADVNARNASGDTPLHMSALNGQTVFAEKLLASGCERKALNSARKTPYDVALTAGNSELADLIQNYTTKTVVTTVSEQLDPTSETSGPQPEVSAVLIVENVDVAHGSQPPLSTAAPCDTVAKRPKTITKQLLTATGGNSGSGNLKVQKQLESSKTTANTKEAISKVMFGRTVSTSSKKLPLSSRLVLNAPSTSKKHRVPIQ